MKEKKRTLWEHSTSFKSQISLECSYLPWQVDTQHDVHPKKGAAEFLGGKRGGSLKTGVGGKPRETPHSCRSCQTLEKGV
jgi:hypothetical protein